MTHLTEFQSVLQQADVIFSREQIMLAIDKMAKKITEQYHDKNPILLTVMNGGLMIAAHLAERLNFPLEMQYCHATRYRGATSGEADLQWPVRPQDTINGRHVIVVDDIYDEGATLFGMLEYLNGKCESVATAMLLDKQHDRKSHPELIIDYVGLECPDRYVFGFGMDYKHLGRNLPVIYAVKGL
ncbi:hypoxanthine-guanine phosphoribosyltransferase [Marinicellulosiphila megalodicopiae]|uniref:hypoxanthine-guanine phosphoribosyltransferase n=1 Tax=Marinicellulosiphila megalodicopiae TaxID=2724896 RepID=UPI003BAF4B7C